MYKTSVRTLITVLAILALTSTAFVAVLHCAVDVSTVHASPANPAHPLTSADGCCVVLCLTALVGSFVLTPALPYFNGYAFTADSVARTARLLLLVPPPRAMI